MAKDTIVSPAAICTRQYCTSTIENCPLKIAAGIVLYRSTSSGPEILIGHLGGPYFARKDEGAWTLPKGEIEPGEDLLTAARREWTEETGLPAPTGDYRSLKVVKQRGGKLNYLFLVEGDADADAMVSNTCTIQWPPRSGRAMQIPEVDRFAWVELDIAERKLTRGLAVVVAQVRMLLQP